MDESKLHGYVVVRSIRAEEKIIEEAMNVIIWKRSSISQCNEEVLVNIRRQGQQIISVSLLKRTLTNEKIAL